MTQRNRPRMRFAIAVGVYVLWVIALATLVATSSKKPREQGARAGSSRPQGEEEAPRVDPAR